MSVVDAMWASQFVKPDGTFDLAAMEEAERDEGRCPNPFCDGHGNIDVSPKMTGRSRTYGTCEVGPHR